MFSLLVSMMRLEPVSFFLVSVWMRTEYGIGNDEIENQLKRDRMMAKNEIKMLLLGAGESGKVSVVNGKREGVIR